MNTVKRDVILSIIKHLREECDNSDLDPEQQESVDVARQCLETTYEVDENAVVQAKDLKEIFLGLSHVADEVVATADAHKVKGNEFMKNDQQREAVLEYTKAIKLNPTNSVYYCNRAAAYSRLEKNREAILDCKEAIKLNPTYGKAYGRLGIAYSKLNLYHDARVAYARALELDPNNESYETNLRLADEQLQQQRSAGMDVEGHGGPAGPAGSGIAATPFDLSAFVNNPALLNMASQMLNEPSFRTMVSDIINTQTRDGPEAGGMDLFQVGEQLAQQLHNANPDIVDALNRLPRGPLNPAHPINDQSDNPAEEAQNEVADEAQETKSPEKSTKESSNNDDP